MMHRFKQNQGYIPQSKQQQSSGLHSQSNSIQCLQYINLLDKCSQILREDRIWLRNQVKAGDEDILKIFKSSKKPINMQHLQIRLRKYVTSVKSKAKMEQLTKFKENLIQKTGNPNSNSTILNMDHKPEFDGNSRVNFNNTVNIKNFNQQNYPQQPRLSSASKQYLNQNQWGARSPHYDNLRSNSHQSLTKSKNKAPKMNSQDNIKPKNSPSVCKNQSNNMQKTFFQKNNVHSNDYPTIEELSERSEINSGRMNNLGGLNAVQRYNQNIQHESGQVRKSNKKTITQTSNQFNEVQEQHEYYENSDPHDYEEESQQDIHYGYEPQSQQSSQKHPSTGKKDRNTNSYEIQNQSSLLPSEHFYNGSQIEHKEHHQTFCQYSYYTSSYGRGQITSSNNNKVAFETANFTSKNNLNLQQNYSKLPVPDTSNLFTSPELLNECRRFIQQQKSGSGGKSSAKKGVDIANGQKFKAECLKFGNLETPIMNRALNSGIKTVGAKVNGSSNFNSFNLDQTHVVSHPLQISGSLNLPSEQIYSHQQDSFGKSFRRENVDQSCSHDSYRYGQTFNVVSSQKNERSEFQSIKNSKNQEQVKYSEELNSYRMSYTSKQGESELVQNMQSSHYQIFKKVASSNRQYQEQGLKKLTQNVQACNSRSAGKQVSSVSTVQQLVDLVVPYLTEDRFVLQSDLVRVLPSTYADYMRGALSSQADGMISIVDVGNILAEALQSLQSEQGEPKQPVQSHSNHAKDLYSLLDIDAKGFISVQDIESFLKQLQDAQVECLEDLSERLWKIFENCEIDEKLYYWVLYTLKDDEEFLDVCAMLEQFEFEIEA